MKKIYTTLFAGMCLLWAHTANAQCASSFFDGFESGSYTPTWTLGPGLTSGAVTTTNPASGIYRLEGTGGVSTHLTGFSTTIPAATPASISWDMFPTGTGATNYFIAGDAAVTATNCVMFCYWLGSSNVIRFVSSSTYQYTCTPGQWYHIEMRNVNYSTHTFDIYIDNVLMSTAFPFRSSSQNNISRLHLYNFNAGVGVWDNISLGPIPVVLNTTSTTSPTCFGGTNGSIDVTVSGGTAPFTFNWSNSALTEDLTNVSAGTYSVVVTDNIGCTDTLPAIILTEPTQITATPASTPASCNGVFDGTASVTAFGGTGQLSYSWSPMGGTNDTATALGAFTYTCTITDDNFCSVNQTVTVTEPPVLTLQSSATDITCNGASDGMAISVAAGGTGPYTYSWNTNPVQTSDTAFALTPGTYTCTVTDVNNCSGTQTVQITEPDVLVATVSQTDNLCYGDAAGTGVVIAAGGTMPYSYSWNSSPAQLTDSASGLTAGSYTCTITDANNCVTTQQITITDPPQLQSTTSSQNITCNGANNGFCGTSVTGGSGSYTYLWSNGATTDSISGLPAGCYYVQVTDANGCTLADTVCITEPAVLGATGITTNVSTCGGANGSVDITPTGGTPVYTYSWSNSSVNEDLSSVPAGTYIVTITDLNGCISTHTFTISDPDLPQVTLNLTTDTVCVDDGTFVLGGQSPAGGVWSGNGVNGNNFSPSTAGVGPELITYTYTDGNNCTALATGTLYVDACVGITTYTNGSFSLYPNPAHDQLFVSLKNEADQITVTLYNALGAKVYAEQFQHRSNFTLSVASLPAGVYSVEIIAGEQQLKQGLVITR